MLFILSLGFGSPGQLRQVPPATWLTASALTLTLAHSWSSLLKSLYCHLSNMDPLSFFTLTEITQILFKMTLCPGKNIWVHNHMNSSGQWRQSLNDKAKAHQEK